MILKAIIKDEVYNLFLKAFKALLSEGDNEFVSV